MRNALAAALLTSALAALPAPGAAQAAGGNTAQEWYEACTVFMNVLTGSGQGSDAEISYCVGQTEGVVNALRTGAQIGAISFAGILTVEAGMNEKAVFELFKRTDPNRLLNICMPPGTQTATQIEAIYRYYEKRTDKAGLPVTALFYDALQERFPCPRPQAPAQGQQKPQGETPRQDAPRAGRPGG